MEGSGQALNRPACVAIVGPTASGKTDLALALARALSGKGPLAARGESLARRWGVLGAEIISADSRQLYAKLDAGTAKPALDPQGMADGIPYGLVGIVDPAERVDAGWYAREAGKAVEAARARRRMPLVAGGTGLYLRALLEGLDPMPRADPAVRRRLESQAAAAGKESLHRRLRELDPAAAARVPAGNLQRVIRALEVRETSGRPLSSFWTGRRPAEGVVALRIERPPEELRERIERRCRAMWPGLLAEARALLKSYAGDEPGFESLGYREAVACVRGALSGEEGLARLMRATRAYAKRQRTWFRTQLASEPIAGAETEVMADSALRLLEAA